MSKLLLFLVFVFLATISLVMADNEKSFNVLGKIKSGIHLAGKWLGLDRAGKVANLVTEAFGKTHKKGDDGGNNIFSGFLRILGFDGKKVGAMALNAIIFVAQMISSSLSLTKPSQLIQAREMKKGTPLEWMLNNTKVVELLDSTKNKNLPNDIVMYLKERSLDEDTDCVQLLVCKSAPFIWGMQRALNQPKNNTVKGAKALFAFLPTIEDVGKHGDDCEKKHPYCFIHI